jgi:glycosyltransferase involved in cell wall biosynthesis
MFSFSIITPTYNRKKKLLDLISSVENCSYPLDRIELIVVDDCSEDDTRSITLDTYKIKVSMIKPKEKVGPAKARNLGVQNSNNDIVFFVDDDNTLLPDTLTQLNDNYHKYPDIIGVGISQTPAVETLKHNIFARYDKKLTTIFSLSKYGIDIKKEYVGGWECPVDGIGATSYKKRVFFEDDIWLPENLSKPGGENAIFKKMIIEKNYKLSFIPTFNVHHQEFSLKGLLAKTRNRAVGEMEVDMYHAKDLAEEEKHYYNMSRDNSFILDIYRSFDLTLILLFTFESAYKKFYKTWYRIKQKWR